MVNILNTFSHLEGYTPGLTMKVLVAAIAFVIFTIIGWLVAKKRPEISIIKTGIVCILWLVSLVTMLTSFIMAHPKYVTMYEATIPKTTSFTDVYDKFDIVEQRGEIYILVDKNPKVFEIPRYNVINN